MIEFSINKYEEQEVVHRRSHISRDYRKQYEMSKGEYALYLKKIPFKKGDLVVSIYTNSVPLRQWDIQLVFDIQEVHHFVDDWGNELTGPRCVGTITSQGNRVWICPNLYRKCTVDELPDFWKDVERHYDIDINNKV